MHSANDRLLNHPTIIFVHKETQNVHDRDSNPQPNDLWHPQPNDLGHEASLPLHHSLNCEQETDIILLY